jgi:hypothetical protein
MPLVREYLWEARHPRNRENWSICARILGLPIRHHRVLGCLDPIGHPFLIDRDPAPARDFESPLRPFPCRADIGAAPLIDIGLDLVNETGRPEAARGAIIRLRLRGSISANVRDGCGRYPG